MNCATITGGIKIERHPGVIQITCLAPLAALENARLLARVRLGSPAIANSQYQIWVVAAG